MQTRAAVVAPLLFRHFPFLMLCLSAALCRFWAFGNDDSDFEIERTAQAVVRSHN
jgi:hypothetical protein